MSTLKTTAIQHLNGSTPNINLDSSGRVGIGTSTPSTPLEVKGSGDTLIRITGGTGNAKGIEFYKGSGSPTQLYNVTDNLIVYTGGLNTMTIDSLGRVTMPYQPAFMVDTVTGGWAGWTSDQVFIFTNVLSNVGSCYSTSTGRFTAPVAGNYYFTAAAYMQGNSTTGRIILTKNGSQFMLSHKSNSGDATLSVSAVIPLAVNDYVDFRNTLYSINIYTGGAHTYFSGHLIG